MIEAVKLDLGLIFRHRLRLGIKFELRPGLRLRHGGRERGGP